MKVFTFLVALAIFLGSLLLFGYAPDAGPGWDITLFFAGIVGASIALAIPFHLLEKFD